MSKSIRFSSGIQRFLCGHFDHHVFELQFERIQIKLIQIEFWFSRRISFFYDPRYIPRNYRILCKKKNDCSVVNIEMCPLNSPIAIICNNEIFPFMPPILKHTHSHASKMRVVGANGFLLDVKFCVLFFRRLRLNIINLNRENSNRTLKLQHNSVQHFECVHSFWFCTFNNFRLNTQTAMNRFFFFLW